MIYTAVLLAVLLRSVLSRFTEVSLPYSIVYGPYFSTRECVTVRDWLTKIDIAVCVQRIRYRSIRFDLRLPASFF